METIAFIALAFFVFFIGFAVGRSSKEPDTFSDSWSTAERPLLRSENDYLKAQLASREDELLHVKRNYRLLSGRQCCYGLHVCCCEPRTIVKKVYADSIDKQELVDLIQKVKISPELDQLKSKLGIA